MSKVLVTGANGMLGQDLCPILEDEGYEVIETDKDILDITDYNSVKRVFESEKPDIVIHCAAYTNVDKAETDKCAAELVNVTGTHNIAKAASQTGAEIVYISTDYVFNGASDKPYLPDDKPEPLNVYGLTKLNGEIAVKKECSKYYIVRTSWLYGVHGKNFVETMLSLADREEIKVVDDQIGCPTWTVELANGIIRLLNNKVYGTYHVCGSGNTSWYGFAKKIFEEAGIEVNLQPCATNEFPRDAKRPSYSVMDNNNICRNWEAALKDYMKLRISD